MPTSGMNADAEHEHIDLDEIYRHVSALSDSSLIALEHGPLPGDTECQICRNLPVSDEHAADVIRLHGTAMRCGVIYGMAKAIRWERWRAGVERLKREHPEAYR